MQSAQPPPEASESTYRVVRKRTYAAKFAARGREAAAVVIQAAARGRKTRRRLRVGDLGAIVGARASQRARTWYRVKRYRHSYRRIAAIAAVTIYLSVGVSIYYFLMTKPCDGARLEEWLALGDSGESCRQRISFVDALYFTIVTMSTVGYGDLSPRADGLRAFTVVYILFGVTIAFYE